MGQIIFVPAVIGNSFATYELATAYNGITNLSAIIAKYADVTLRGDTAGNKTECNCAPSLDGFKFNSITLPFDVWVTVVNDIATNIQNALGSGVAATSLQIAAEYVAPYFLNISFWNKTGWDATTAAAYYASRNPNISLRFVPHGSQGGNNSIGGNVGFFGNSVVNGANLIRIGGFTAMNGKSVTVTISGINGSGNYTSVGSATATIASGIFSASISATITPGTTYFVGITSASIFAHSDFGGSVFNGINIGYGKDFAGVNAGLQIDQWGVVGA